MVKSKVLAFCLQKIPSAIVGVNHILAILQERGSIDFRFKETLNVNKEDIAWADIIISIRGCEDLELEIINEGRRLEKFLVYFLDDDLLNIPTNSASATYFSMDHIRSNITQIIKTSDYLWTTNKNIAQRYDHYSKASIVVNAPSLLLERIEPWTQKEHTEKTIIGFSGSIDHSAYINDFLKKVVSNVLELYPNVFFEFFGAKPNFVNHDRVEHIPYASNYNEYIETMGNRRWDIGLAPLPLSEFHSCKYFNKFLEYGAIGTPGIYSNVEPYIFIVENEKNGLLVNNTPDEWVRAIQSLIEDTSLRMKIKENSHDQLKTNFTVEEIANELVSQLPALTTYRAPSCSVNQVKFKEAPRNIYLFKVLGILKSEGLKGIFTISKKIFNKIKSR